MEYHGATWGLHRKSGSVHEGYPPYTKGDSEKDGEKTKVGRGGMWEVEVGGADSGYIL